MAIVADNQRSAREITDEQIEALRLGDCDVLPQLLQYPQLVHRLPSQKRQSVLSALWGIIGDSRGMFSNGAKKESAVAMRIISNIVATPTSVECSSEFKMLLRTMGVEELKKLKLERHLLSNKDDVAPAAVEFVKTMLHVIRCEPSDFIQNSAALAKLDQVMQSLRSGAGAESERRQTTPTTEPSTGGQTAGGQPGAGGQAAQGGNNQHRVRSLPSKPSSIPHEANPMFDEKLPSGLLNINTPNPVLSFAKHFGLGCIPRIPKYTEGGSLTLNLPRRQSQADVGATGTAQGPPSVVTPPPDPTPTSGAAVRSGWSAMPPQATGQVPQALASPVVPRPQANPTSPPPVSRQPQSPSATSSPLGRPQPPPPPQLTTADSLSPVPSSRVPAARPSLTPQSSSLPVQSESVTTRMTSPNRSAVPAPLEVGTPGYDLVRRYITTEGVMVGWGQNRCGELGLGTNTASYTPRSVPLAAGRVVHIACGSQYSLMLTKTGQLISCGTAEWGQLGIGDPLRLTELLDSTTPICTTPTQVRGFKPNDVLAEVCAGYAFAVAVTENGEMYLWGNNNHGQCSLGSQLKPDSARVAQPLKVGMKGTRVVSVACGSFFVVILTASGTVLSWGLVSVLGLGAEEDVLRMIDRKWCAESLSREKRSVVLCPCKVSALDGKGVIQLAAGQWHVLAVCDDGAVYTWGVGHQGRLGHGVANQETKPRLIESLRHAHIIQGSCGSFHSCVVARDGRVFVFGDNANGQCGMNGQPFYLSPTLLPLPGPAISVSCGREQTAILLADGDVMVCGSSASIGVGLGVGSRFMAPTRILSNFISLALHTGVSHSFSLAIPRALELVPIGTLHAGPPSKITSMMLKDGLISAALGANFTVVVNRNGETFAFGNGDWGQLGMGSSALLQEKSPVEGVPVVLHPQRIQELSQVRIASVSAGFAFVLAISEQQRVYFWGNNNHSQGGLGPSMRSTPRVETPVEISSLSTLGDKGVVQIACGSFFVLALTSTMEVYSWGIADCCGHGKDPLDVPPEVLTTSTSSEARQVIATPCKINTLSNVVTIAAGQWHALALTDKGFIYAWGVGHQGRLGTGDTTTRYVPTKLGLSLPCASIGCGSFHSWALTTASDLYMWGDNDSGQCANGDGKSASDADTVLLLPQHVASGVRSVSCGRQHSVIITHDGRIRMAGLITHQDKPYKCRSLDAQPQPPPLIGLMSSGKFALASFSGPYHTFILAEKERPAASAVTDACVELRALTKRGGNSGATPS